MYFLSCSAPFVGLEEYSMELVSRYSTVRSGTITWREWGLWFPIFCHFWIRPILSVGMVGIRCQHNICSSSKHQIGYFWATPTSSGWLQMAGPNSCHDIGNNHADSSTTKAYHNGTCVVLYNWHVALHPLNKQCSREVGSPLISLLSTGSLSQGDNTIWFTVRAPVPRRIFLPY